MAELKDSDQGYASDLATEAKADSKFVIDRKTAEAEFERYCNANDLDCDMDNMNDDEKKDFEPMRKRFVKACMQGRVKVDGTDLIYTISDFTQPPFRGREVTIKRCDGKSYMGMDNYKDMQSVRRLHAILAEMTGQEIGFFAKLDSKDWKFFKDIATLFLVE